MIDTGTFMSGLTLLMTCLCAIEETLATNLKTSSSISVLMALSSQNIGYKT